MRGRRTTWRAVIAAAAAVLAGCLPGRGAAPVEPAPGGPAISIVATGPDPRALHDGFTPVHPRRAVLGRAREWKASFDEPWREPSGAGSPKPPFEVLVAEERSEGVRVVVEGAGVRVALWVLPGDLMAVPTERVVLCPAPDEPVAGDGPSVQLAPGGPAVVVERKDGWVLFDVDTPAVRAGGWALETRVGRVYERHDFNVAFEIADLEPSPGTTVHDRPYGAELAVLRPDAGAHVRVKSLGAEQDGWREVLYPSPTLLVRGWVRADRLAAAEALASPSPPAPAEPTSEGEGEDGEARVALPAGTEVRTAPDGDVLAFCFADVRLRMLEDRPSPGAWVLLPTPWGDVTGWVAGGRAVERSSGRAVER
ncbi:MAG: hypothetical protein HY905_28025 [Deltaproteobacteria bacterium]|nr:hypothetical protein [Deltaproteobacteria bacterium]